jgi:hypothetical protein
MKELANRDDRDFGREIAHEAVSRRPPTSLDTIVARTEGYTYGASVWDLYLVQGAFSVAHCPTLMLRFATCCTVVFGCGLGVKVLEMEEGVIGRENTGE